MRHNLPFLKICLHLQIYINVVVGTRMWDKLRVKIGFKNIFVLQKIYPMSFFSIIIHHFLKHNKKGIL